MENAEDIAKQTLIATAATIAESGDGELAIGVRKIADTLPRPDRVGLITRGRAREFAWLLLAGVKRILQAIDPPARTGMHVGSCRGVRSELGDLATAVEIFYRAVTRGEE